MEDLAGGGRFEIQRRLGEGGFGTVYAAFDRVLGMPVAMKRLRSRSPEALYRFKREFRSLADVTHPNLVSLYELFQEKEEWFFTMELVPGRHLFEYLRPGYSGQPNETTVEMPKRARHRELPDSLPPLDLPLLRTTMGQLARALSALHNVGLLHRDLKSSNVLVTGEGRVVVLDFGLVTEALPRGDGGEGMVVGTPHYMSPEQWLGGEVGEASDWYSFGVVLYEALTGIPPHDGSPTELAINRMAGEVVPPSQLDPTIPSDLSRLCEELLRVVPAQRPRGSDVIRRLGSDGVGVGAREGERPPRAFVDRVQEMSALRDAFLATARGKAVTVHMTGDSGIGKTALFDQFLRSIADQHRAVILRGRSYAQESLPYKAVDGAIDELSRFLARMQSSELSPLLPEGIDDLAQLFPVLRRAPAIAAGQRDEHRRDDRSAIEVRRHAFAALRELVARLAATRPVIVCLDDVHWGDLDSVRLLDALMRPPDAPPIMLVLSYRQDPSVNSPFLREQSAIEHAVGSRADVRHVALSQIPAEECEALAAVLLARPNVSSRTITRIAREAGGNPLFVEELVRFAALSGEESERPEAVELHSEERRVLLHGVVQRRLAELPESWQRLIELCGIAGQPIDVEAAREAVGLETLDGTVLNRLRAGHLVRTHRSDGREQISPFHDRIRSVVLATLTPERRLELHTRLAEALVRGGRARPGVIAHHLHAAGQTTRAADYAYQAAEQAAAALAFDDAAQLYAQVLDWQPGDAERQRSLCAKLADAQANAGRCAEAAPTYLRAADGAPPLRALELRRRAAEQYLMGGHTDEGLAVLDPLCRTIGVKRSRTPGRALLSLAADVVRLKLRGTSFKERAEADVAPEELARIDLCISAGRNLLLRDPIVAQRFTARALRLALAAGEPSRIVEGLAAVGSALAMAGQKDGHRMLARAREIADRIGTPYVLGLLSLWSAFVDHNQGNWVASLAAWDEAATLLAQCRGVTSELQKAQLNGILAIQLLGRFDELERRTERAMTEGRASGNRYTEVYARLYSSMPPLAAGDPKGARERIDEARARAPAGDHYTAVTALKFEAWCDVYTGHAADGLTRIAAAWPSLEESKMMRMSLFRVVFRSLRGGLSLAVRGKDGVALAESDAKGIAGDRQPYAVGQHALLCAGIAVARGDVARAEALCEEGARAFDSVGLGLEALFARRSIGLLRGGEAGRVLVAEADRVLRERGLADPARFCQSQVPALASLHGAS